MKWWGWLVVGVAATLIFFGLLAVLDGLDEHLRVQHQHPADDGEGGGRWSTAEAVPATYRNLGPRVRPQRKVHAVTKG